ncbi:MAG: glycosyltransferase family 4 protein [Lachnospiraceae bacterium]|nr:glycosyltransferase family 4 protein [Lachnospiraceae bacterium]
MAEPLRVAVFYGYEQPWENVNLIKDCGLIPFLLHQNHGFEVSLIGTRRDVDYTYTKFVPGLTLVPLDSFDAAAKAAYVKAHAADIDVLMLFGSYYDSMLMAETYKAGKPDGFIFLSTDFNEDWVRRIPFQEPRYYNFYERCDLIGVPTPGIADYIHSNWPWPVHVFRNGYYHFDKTQPVSRPFQEKENIILTVGRLGTEQKRTDTLLLAFAKVSVALPDWKLRLVGGVEPAFQEFIDALFDEMPDLRERITFTGLIEDRAVLHEEYLRARICAMTSFIEGGTNVFCEALTAGCAIASTDISAAEDAVGESHECGLLSPVGDYDAFADILLRLCQDAELSIRSENAVKRGLALFQMEAIVEEIVSHFPSSRAQE